MPIASVTVTKRWYTLFTNTTSDDCWKVCCQCPRVTMRLFITLHSVHCIKCLVQDPYSQKLHILLTWVKIHNFNTLNSQSPESTGDHMVSANNVLLHAFLQNCKSSISLIIRIWNVVHFLYFFTGILNSQSILIRL